MSDLVEVCVAGDDQARWHFFGPVVALVCVALCGCWSKVVWSSTAVTSPDGKWVASAQTKEWSGPGIGTVTTSVYLERTGESRQAQVVVSYTEENGFPRPQIEWKAARDLIVHVPNPDPAYLNMLVVKFAEIRISVASMEHFGPNSLKKNQSEVEEVEDISTSACPVRFRGSQGTLSEIEPQTTTARSQFMSAAQQGLSTSATPCNWEMGQIYQAGRQGTVTFMQGGQVVPNPFHWGGNMPTEIIQSKRQFQIWKYTVGHSSLLIRSTKSREFATRIDVFFKGVREFHMPTIFTGLSITEASDADVQRLCSLRASPSFGKDVKVFKVQGTDFLGYIAALIVVCHEDEGEYNDPSFFAKDNFI